MYRSPAGTGLKIVHFHLGAQKLCLKLDNAISTEHTQRNGAKSKLINKFIASLPTLAQHTLSAAGTVQVCHELPAVRFSCLLRECWTVSKIASQQEKVFCVLHFVVSRCDYSAA
jgi:hypothetical protein